MSSYEIKGSLPSEPFQALCTLALHFSIGMEPEDKVKLLHYLSYAYIELQKSSKIESEE